LTLLAEKILCKLTLRLDAGNPLPASDDSSVVSVDRDDETKKECKVQTTDARQCIEKASSESSKKEDFILLLSDVQTQADNQHQDGPTKTTADLQSIESSIVQKLEPLLQSFENNLQLLNSQLKQALGKIDDLLHKNMNLQEENNELRQALGLHVSKESQDPQEETDPLQDVAI
jgi:hypothetical protein